MPAVVQAPLLLIPLCDSDGNKAAIRSFRHQVKKELTARLCCQLSRICFAVFYRKLKKQLKI
jgi:hypothetical protein